nr:nitrogenase component 1 [uncultured Desulfobacter sp.]
MSLRKHKDTPSYTATQNACKMCTPLGATLVFQGIEGCVPLLHGSQGCSTYMRRYLISHFKEPVDITFIYNSIIECKEDNDELR